MILFKIQLIRIISIAPLITSNSITLQWTILILNLIQSNNHRIKLALYLVAMELSLRIPIKISKST